MAGKYFGIPFALSGDRTAIPDAAQPDGSVSFTQGFTLDYELENTDPNYKPVPREETNALYYDITEAIGIVQKQGFADWTIAAAPYPVAAFVRHNDIVWRSNIAANSNEPGTDSTWSNTEIPEPNLPAGYFYGFTLANNSGAPNTTVGVSAGAARDSADAVNIKLAGTLRGILQSSGTWAAGDNQNKLDTGARANLTWYHVFAIRKISDGTGDILFSLSATAPVMPSGYAGFRRIGSIRTDGTGNILGFLNFGRKFYWTSLVRDVSVSGGSSGESTITLRVPSGVNVLAHCDVHARGDNNAIYLRPVGTSSIDIAGPQTSAWIAGTGVDVTSVALEAGAGRVSVISQNSQAILQVNTGGYGVTTIYWEEL